MQVIDCRKVKTKTLIIRTDLQDGVMDGLSLVSDTEDYCRGMQLKKSLNQYIPYFYSDQEMLEQLIQVVRKALICNRLNPFHILKKLLSVTHHCPKITKQ